MITRFENFMMPDVNSVSKEFWKMTTVVNWKKVIVDYKNANKFSNSNSETWQRHKMIKEYALKRLCLKYEYNQIKNFQGELDFMYNKLYFYFKEIWLNNKLGVSDDGYWDLLTSVIGSGKKFTKECILYPKTLVDMAKKIIMLKILVIFFLLMKKNIMKLNLNMIHYLEM